MISGLGKNPIKIPKNRIPKFPKIALDKLSVLGYFPLIVNLPVPPQLLNLTNSLLEKAAR
jgi:hypothetical protein